MQSLGWDLVSARIPPCAHAFCSDNLVLAGSVEDRPGGLVTCPHRASLWDITFSLRNCERQPTVEQMSEAQLLLRLPVLFSKIATWKSLMSPLTPIVCGVKRRELSHALCPTLIAAPTTQSARGSWIG